jgi:hypothetical protein
MLVGFQMPKKLNVRRPMDFFSEMMSRFAASAHVYPKQAIGALSDSPNFSSNKFFFDENPNCIQNPCCHFDARA